MSEVFIPGEDSMGMTDLQFISYKEERDKTEEALRQEIDRLRRSIPTVDTECKGVTDYQTRILLAAIADMLYSSVDIHEARTRFNAITGSEFSQGDTAGQN